MNTEELNNAFNAVIDQNYSPEHRKVLNTLGEYQFQMARHYLNIVSNCIPDEHIDVDNPDEFEELMRFGLITFIDIASIDYWLSKLTEEI